MSAKSTHPKIKPIEEFPKVEKMIYNLAWHFARKFPFPNEQDMFEECRSIAFQTYMNCWWDFDSTRASFVTYIHKKVYWRLQTHIMEMSKHPVELVEDISLLTPAVSPEVNRPMRMLHELSDDARIMMDLILETPRDVRYLVPHNVKGLMNRVKHYMVHKRQHSAEQTEAAHLELKNHFAEALTV